MNSHENKKSPDNSFTPIPCDLVCWQAYTPSALLPRSEQLERNRASPSLLYNILLRPKTIKTKNILRFSNTKRFTEITVVFKFCAIIKILKNISAGLKS